MTVIRNFGVTGVASSIEFGKRGGTLNYDNATKVFSFALSSALTIPSGTNAQRPTTGTVGMLRVNTEGSAVLELYNGASWQQVGSGGSGGGTGTVTTLSIVTANGFTGTVANPTSTPAVTLGTTVQGLVKGVSGSLVAASTATDYQVPLTLTTTGTGPATFNGRVLNIPTAGSGVVQILAGTNITVQSTAGSGTGVVTIGVSTTTASSLSGGLATQIPYQTAPSTTGFSSKFTWNNTLETLTLGGFGSTAIISGTNASSSFSAASILVKGGNANALAAPGNVTIGAGDGFGSTFRGGNLILQGGNGSIGSGEVLIRTSETGTMVDRVRFLRTGAWSVGPTQSYTGDPGQVLTSQGSDQPPIWQNPGGAAGVSQILAGEGIALSPAEGIGTVTITATGGGGGGGIPGGNSGELQYNKSGTFSGTDQLLYTSNTLTVGSVNSTFTISSITGSDPTKSADLLIKSGDQYGSVPFPTKITIAGGNSYGQSTNGASIYLDAGLGSNTGTSVGGTIYLRTGDADQLYERLRIDSTGAWGLSGANYGSAGQVLTSQGPGLPPLWVSGGGGGGGTGSGVTFVGVSGGTTGLTTSGGPITSAGTITLGGTLNVSNGGTGRTQMPGINGSLFFNNLNTFDAIGGMTYDGSGKLYLNNIAISSDDVFTEFTPVSPITIKPGTSRNINGFAANVNIAGGDILSSINRAGNAVISGGVNTTASKSGYVVLKTNNLDRLTISETGAFGVPGLSGANYGTPGQVLSSQGPNFPPIWVTGSGTGTAGVISVTANAPIYSSGGDTPTIYLGTVPANLGGTGYSNYTAGDILWAKDASTLETLNIGAPGQVLTVLNNRPQWSSSLAGVQSFSGGNTGLTPATYTTGLITLGGRLNIAFGGTGGNTKASAFNNLAPTQFNGDIIYFDINGGNKRLPIGSSGTVLMAGNNFPEWKSLSGMPGALPIQTGNYGRFLTTTETSANTGALWSDLITWTAAYNEGSNNINISATDAKYPYAPGGNVNISAGNSGGYTGGNIHLIIGNTGREYPWSSYFEGSFAIFRKPNVPLFNVSQSGAFGFEGFAESNYGTTGQVLTSRGPNQTPFWTNSGLPLQDGKDGKWLTTNGTTSSWSSLPDNVAKIVAGNSNIVVTPDSGTGIVTLSVVGAGFGGVTSFSAGSTGFLPNSATTGPIVLTGTLLVTSGGTGQNSYSTGDILYASTPTTLAKLPIGLNGRLLSSNGSVPYWAEITGLPNQTSSPGYFLSTNGASAAWSSKIAESGLSVTVQALDGISDGSSGGNVLIKGGSANGVGTGGGGIITLQTGSDSSAGYFAVRGSAVEFLRITRFGSLSLGPSGTNTGNFGQVLTSTGPNTAPTWTSAAQGLPEQSGYAGFFLTTDGSTASWIAVPGGTGAPGGSSGQLQYNNAGAFAGTQQISYDSNTLRLGNANTFNIVGVNSPDPQLPGTNINIQGGQSGATTLYGNTAAAGNVTIRGGAGKTTVSEGSGGSVFIYGGTSSTASTATVAGYVSIGTGQITTERIRFQANGSWLVSGQTGASNQALVSGGSGATPSWKTLVNRIIPGSNITIASTGPSGNGDVTINATAAPPTPATTNTLGVIKVGSGLSITGDGTLSATGGGTGTGAVSSVTATFGLAVSTNTGNIIVSGLPATASTPGVVRIGRGLSITSTGTLSVPPEQFELAFAATGLAGNGTIFIYTASRVFTVPQNMIGSYAVALNPATNTTPMQMFQLVASTGVINNIGLINFPAGQFNGVPTFGSDIIFNPGDTLFMRINVAADATLGNISVTISAILA